MVAGPGERHVEKTPLLGLFLEALRRLRLVPACGLEAADLEPALPRGVADDGALDAVLAGEDVGQDDDRVLEALGLVDGDDLDLGAGLLAHRGVALLGARLALLLEEADDGAQGGRARGLVGAGDVDGLPEVGDGLVAAGAEAEAGQGAGSLEEGMITSLGGATRRRRWRRVRSFQAGARSSRFLASSGMGAR